MLLTREVRWFFEGRLPDEVLDWFTDTSGAVIEEHRTDLYELASARRGIGRKLRAGISVDTKIRRAERPAADLAPGLHGRVEDWLKVSEPAHLGGLGFAGDVELSKHLRTRSYPLNREPTAGCEAELGEVRWRNVASWTICFETWGPPQLRAAAFTSGIAAFVHDSPIPDFLATNGISSFGYPAWICDVAVRNDIAPASVS